MLRVSIFLRLLRQAFETSLEIGEPLSRDSLEGSIGILKSCEAQSAAMEDRLSAPDLGDLPNNVVSLQAWLEAKLTASPQPIQ